MRFCHVTSLPAEDGLAEREKIRQQLLDGGIAEEHADAIMRIVPYENGAHPRRADGGDGETHNYPNKRKGAVTTSKENDKNTRKKVEDESKLLAEFRLVRLPNIKARTGARSLFAPAGASEPDSRAPVGTACMVCGRSRRFRRMTLSGSDGVSWKVGRPRFACSVHIIRTISARI